ncbi:MAG TPA: TolC family protein [Candidatus Dormibacteraeota bacterium]|nr:TolC family protein [Candidatus Dormibacteraeota bacterium]
MKPNRPPLARRARAAAGLACALLALVVPPVAVAADAPLTLAAAVARALREAPDARIARLEAEQADDAAAAARSLYWPHASVSSQAGWSNRQDDTINAIDGQGNLKRYPLSTLGSAEPWLGLYIDQVLFDLRQWRDVQRSELEAEAAAVAEAQQREGISAAVLDQYLEVVRLEALGERDQQRLRDAEWLDRQARSLLGAGRALPNEQEQVALEVEQAQLDADERTAQLAHARAVLARLIGDDGEAAALRIDASSLPAVRATPDDREAALASSPELRILALRQRMEELTLDAARAGRYPTLAVRGGYFHYGTKRFSAFEQELAIGVDLKVPVFDGFQASANIDRATKAADAARLRYDAVHEEKRDRAAELERRVGAALQQEALATRRAKIAAERLRLADASLKGQRGSLLEALAARADAIRDARGLVDAQLESVRAWAALQRERGHLAVALVGEEAAAPQAAK